MKICPKTECFKWGGVGVIPVAFSGIRNNNKSMLCVHSIPHDHNVFCCDAGGENDCSECIDLIENFIDEDEMKI